MKLKDVPKYELSGKNRHINISRSRNPQPVKRHKNRFPDDFMFQLSRSDYESLISQFVTSKKPGRGGIRKMPYASTEQGVDIL